jgi:NADPH-dependent 2,4-dienoyl-CoA reductase/sulfur reductase-like enzyme
VWSAEKKQGSYTINYLRADKEESILAEKIILATGAYDRTLPFPGWDTPGVVTAGGAQALLKGHGVLAGKKIVIAGTGPFLFPVATGLASAGAQIVGVFEAHSPLRWLRSLPALIRNPLKIFELLHYLKLLSSLRIRTHFGSSVISAKSGSVTVARVDRSLKVKAGSEKSFDCDVLAVGWGFTPDLSLAGILGCAQRVDSDGTVVVKVDAFQQSSQPNIWVAGEATGIGGADLALIEGEIAGLSAAGKKIPHRIMRKKSARESFARALQRSYPIPHGWQIWLTGQTLICRCEEVSLDAITSSVDDLGAQDSRTVKLFTRAGMGLCQGRVCSQNVSEIVGNIRGCAVSDQERIAGSNRPIAAPITLGQLGDGIESD